MDKQLNIINLNEFTWQLNIALAGLVFSIFSLIYNDEYIYYGFFVFLFGLLGHIGYKFFVLLFDGDKEGDRRWVWYYLYLSVLIAGCYLVIKGTYFG